MKGDDMYESKEEFLRIWFDNKKFRYLDKDTNLVKFTNDEVLARRHSHFLSAANIIRLYKMK
jgi:hypothetical protein